MDGEKFSNSSTYDVTVAKWFKKDDTPREVITTLCGTRYRYTTKNGWREYCYETKTFRSTCGTGTIIQFIPEN